MCRETTRTPKYHEINLFFLKSNLFERSSCTIRSLHVDMVKILVLYT